MADERLPFRLRPAHASDQDVIKQMVRRARLNPLGLNWKRFTVVVDDQGNVIGCVQLKLHADGTVELASLVVKRPWRQRGVGGALIGAVKSNTGGPLWLMCRQNLISFYEKFGFRVVERASDMNSYFRRIWYLSRIATFLTLGNVRLAIMCWESS